MANALATGSSLLCLLIFACGGGQSAGSGGDGARTEASSSGSSGGGVGGGASSSGSGSPEALVTYGEVYEGGEFHLGPVDWEETAWHNACAPAGGYHQAVRQAQGELLAGLWGGLENVAGFCDACISVRTARGNTALLRVVTYGETTPNSIDVSPAAFALLDDGEYPRSVSWQFAKCPDTGPLMFEFQTQASEWWSSLWVRNARVPLLRVEVQSANHASFHPLQRGGDGTLTDASGFGQGAFSLRLTGADGQVLTERFEWPAGGLAGHFLTGARNFE